MIDLTNDYPSKCDLFLAEINKTGKSDAMGAVHAVTVRIPSFEFARIEAIGRVTGLTRNKIIVNLIEIGIEDMREGIDPDIGDLINGMHGQIVHDLISSGDFSTSEKGEI
jgi:hypothetical protein